MAENTDWSENRIARNVLYKYADTHKFIWHQHLAGDGWNSMKKIILASLNYTYEENHLNDGDQWSESNEKK